MDIFLRIQIFYLLGCKILILCLKSFLELCLCSNFSGILLKIELFYCLNLVVILNSLIRRLRIRSFIIVANLYLLRTLVLLLYKAKDSLLV